MMGDSDTQQAPEKLHDQLSRLVRERLDVLGWSQADLGREMGLSPKHINHLVNGKSGALGMYDYAAFVMDAKWSVSLRTR